jgi:hypothetical protein
MRNLDPWELVIRIGIVFLLLKNKPIFWWKCLIFFCLFRSNFIASGIFNEQYVPGTRDPIFSIAKFPKHVLFGPERYFSWSYHTLCWSGFSVLAALVVLVYKRVAENRAKLKKIIYRDREEGKVLDRRDRE